MTSIGRLADELLETIALEDEAYFQRHGFYTTRTRAGDCKVGSISRIPKSNEGGERLMTTKKEEMAPLTYTDQIYSMLGLWKTKGIDCNMMLIKEIEISKKPR